MTNFWFIGSLLQYITMYCTKIQYVPGTREAATTTCCWIGAKTSNTVLCTTVLYTLYTMDICTLPTILNIIILCISVFWTTVLCTSVLSLLCTPVLNSVYNCTVHTIHTVLCENENSILQQIA